MQERDNKKIYSLCERGNMKITTKYSSVESVTYEFDEWDIRCALIDIHKIPVHKGKVEFEIYEKDDDGKHVAELTIRYETVKDSKE